jgi:hypothetical protein
MDEMEWDSIGGWLTSECDIQATIVLFWLVVWSVKFSVLFFFRRFLDSVPTYMDGVSSLPSFRPLMILASHYQPIANTQCTGSGT